MPGRLDHLVVTGETLAAAAAHVEATLGLDMAPGGAHAAMGTHNRLLSLGAADYLEAIAIDPGAPAPAWPRWFGLDARPGSPRLAAWALRVTDLDAVLADAPTGIGAPMALTRGAYRWRLTVPETGVQPFDGVFPALIEWDGAPPAPALPDHGARLVSLELSHPRAGALGWMLSLLLEDDRVVVREGKPKLTTVIHTAAGDVVLT